MIAMHLKRLLEPSELQRIDAALQQQTFSYGGATAAPLARQAKHNQELLASGSTDLGTLGKVVEQALSKNPYLEAWALPHRISTVLFNRYDTGMYYGDHIDSPLGQSMPSGYIRMDLAFTVFLSDPASYEGGELVINSTTERQAIKLPAGDAVVYPASTIHRVNKVQHGVRLAAVGWIESLVRDHAQREMLFDLRVLHEALLAKREESDPLVLLEKCRANLLRMWADV
jgi:PKHD-type hydroxylase